MKIVLTFFLELAFFIVAINWYSICYSRVRTFILSYIVYANIGKVQSVLKCQNNVINRHFSRIVMVLSFNSLRLTWIYRFSICHRIVMIYIKLRKWIELRKFA